MTVGTPQPASNPAPGPQPSTLSTPACLLRPTSPPTRENLPSSHHTASSTIWGSHHPQQGPFEYDHGDKPHNMPLRGRLKEKGPSDSLPLFPVCTRKGLADSRGAVKQSVWHQVTSTVICMFQAVIPSLCLTRPAGAYWKCAEPQNAFLLGSSCRKAEGLS